MRQTVSTRIWKHPRRARAALGLSLGLVFSAVFLGGCVISNPFARYDDGVSGLPTSEVGPWGRPNATAKERLLAASDFSVEIVRFTDNRRPRSMEMLSSDQTIYQYDPDQLLGGVSYQVPGMLGKYLSYRPKMPKHYKVEIDLKRLETVIKTGKLWSGSWGRYTVTAEVMATVRRPDSSVVFIKTYSYDPEEARKDYNGRGPSKERDRARMFDMTSEVMRAAAQDIGWDIRQKDSRWNPAPPQSINTRLNQPPIDRAAGTTDADAKPPVNAPFVVPSAPAEAPSDLWLDTPSDMWIDEPYAPEAPKEEMKGPDGDVEGTII